MSDQELVLVERNVDRVAHVVLNRPERRNALIGPLADELGAQLEALNDDTSVSVIVIRGAGGAFCSGLDIGEFAADPPPSWVPEFAQKWRRVHHALFDSDRIVVGALERFAINGGAALALACDFLIAGESSFLQVGEIQQGMAAPMNMAWLRLRFSEALAGRVALLGDRIPGPELLRLGIAHDCVADDEVVAAAASLAERVAAHDPAGVRRIKASLRRTVVTESAQDWFDRPGVADPLPAENLRPRRAGP